MKIPKYSVDDIDKFIKKNNSFYILGVGFEAIRIKKRLENASKKVISFVDLSFDGSKTMMEDISIVPLQKYLEDDKPLLIASLQDIESANWEIEATALLINKYNKKPFKDFVSLMGYFEGMEHMSRYKLLIGKYFYDYYIENKEFFNLAQECLEDEYSKKIFKKIIDYKLMCLDSDEIETKSLLIVSQADMLEVEKNQETIKKDLTHIDDDRLLNMTASHLAVESYSYKNIVSPRNKNIIFDIGAYNGDTALMFSYLSKESKVYSFEPVIELNGQLSVAARISPNITIVNKGAWSTTTTLKFSTLRRDNYIGVGSFVSDKGDDQIDVTTIDEFMLENSIGKADFIKMDIEGAEVNALDGAKTTIEKYKPDLAICIYHEPSHLWEIPLWIKNNFPEYKVYIDHKYIHPVESVCYATIDK